MRRKVILNLIVVSLVVGCNKSRYNEDVIQYLSSNNIEAGGAKGIISNLTVKKQTVTISDIEMICQINTLETLYFNHSRINAGVIRHLQKCNNLKSIIYQYNSNLPLNEIEDHNLIPNLIDFHLWTSMQGDELMPYLAELHLDEVDLSGGETETVTAPGILTNNGIRKYAEYRANDKPIRLTFVNQPLITDDAFQYFLQIKGLTFIDFGSKTSVTEDGVKRFVFDYRKKYGKTLAVVHHM